MVSPLVSEIVRNGTRIEGLEPGRYAFIWPPFAGITQVRLLAVGSIVAALSARRTELPREPLCRQHPTAIAAGGQAALASTRRRQDADEDAGHGRLEVGAVVDPRGVPLEGGAAFFSDVDRDAPVLLDPPRLEARALGREVDRVLVQPAPRRHGARLAGLAVRREIDVVGAAQGSGERGRHGRHRSGAPSSATTNR